MGIDRQGKSTGEKTPNKSTQRSRENKPDSVTHQVNQVKDKVKKVFEK